MGTTKDIAYTDRQNELAALIKSIAHPARIAILEYLLKTNACVCGDIVNELNIAQATVSQHLKEMKKIGLIQGNISGRCVCYCINPLKYKELKDGIDALLKPFASSTICC